MSETTDPTAGERVCRRCGVTYRAANVGVLCNPPHSSSHDFPPAPTAGEPDAGDVEALAPIRRFAESKAITAKALGHEDRDWLDLLILCDRAESSLDAVRRKAGDERAEQAWDEGWEHSVHPKDHNPYRTARIARESR